MDLRERITHYLVDRGMMPEFGPVQRETVRMQDDSDGRGPYISVWASELGLPPGEADGFSKHELKKVASG